jgi:2-oxoglutarate dehydrogenase E1 component
MRNFILTEYFLSEVFLNSNFSSVFQSNAGYVEDMFQRFSQDSASVSSEWRAYFEGFNEGFGAASTLLENTEEVLKALKATASLNVAKTADPQFVQQISAGTATDAQQRAEFVAFEISCAELVQSYKSFGHLAASLDPLGKPRPAFAGLNLEAHSLNVEQLSRSTKAGILVGLPGTLSLEDLINHLKSVYCGSVGIEVEHIQSEEERRWLHQQTSMLKVTPSSQTQKSIFLELAKADALEKTIANKFIGKKRFSIEGADAQIPALESYMQACQNAGTEEFTLAMAHRGRLNTLVHCAGKPMEILFAEFEGYPHPGIPGDWDVKYHSGWESERPLREGKNARVSLCFNPSHLEFVDAVVLGETRAKQVAYHKGDKNKVVPICMHGDAAFAGQGVVYESMQMMKLRAYDVGGCLHLVANNQVGFTTNPLDSRSTTYCTDIGKALDVPVFHVNADDLQGLHNVMLLAAEYRHKFGKDFCVDMVCFRRQGHNETDEPRFTQPVLYKAVDAKPAPYETYKEFMIKTGAPFTTEEMKTWYDDLRTAMTAVFDKVKTEHTPITTMPLARLRSALTSSGLPEMLASCGTKCDLASIKSVGEHLAKVPAGFKPHPKLSKIILGERSEMLAGNKPIDWGFGELLSYGTLLKQGFGVRLIGQDARRGTFSHRHVFLVDSENAQVHSGLLDLAQGDARFEVYDSFLSETAAMGFEYGYSAQHPQSLTIWEGQFGDFSNGAQVIIDQFIASGETKWNQQNGLVLLLPHGYEGQGPEHSSGRLERFLQLCAQGNMQVCYLTKVSQLFHAMRRQVMRDFRKPLVIMSPKSFLRSPRASCSFDELSQGQFEEVLDDSRKLEKTAVTKLILCSGKIGIDLLDSFEKLENTKECGKLAVLRLEQIYPLHQEKLVKLMTQYRNVKEIVWCQEEPENMGAWSHLAPKLAKLAADKKWKLSYVGRSERASPAVGLEKQHVIEQGKILDHAKAGSGDLRV